jgi:hypothetical protein
MLCDTCKSFDIGGLCFQSSQVNRPCYGDPDYTPVEVLHHNSYKELRAAAKGGCELCLEILRGSDRYGDHTRFESQNPPIYCSAIDISHHKRDHSTFCEEEFKGVAVLLFRGFPVSSRGTLNLTFWADLRVFCEHGMHPPTFAMLWCPQLTFPAFKFSFGCCKHCGRTACTP